MRDIRATVEIDLVRHLSPDDLSAAIADLRGHVHAIGVVAIDHPLVHRAIFDCVRDNVPVLSMLSRINSPDVAGYVGIDRRSAGRTTGWMMARCVTAPGLVGILIGSHRYIGQEDRDAGFRSYMREHARGRRLRDTFVYLDDARVAYEAASKLIGSVPDLVGIYHCGGGNQRCRTRTSRNGERHCLHLSRKYSDREECLAGRSGRRHPFDTDRKGR